jgi:hypothetical protein
MGSVLRWAAIVGVAAPLLCLCYQIIEPLTLDPLYFPVLILCICLAASATFLCERYELAVAAPFVAGTVGLVWMGMFPTMALPKAEPEGFGIGLFVSLLVLLLLFGESAKPNEEL